MTTSDRYSNDDNGDNDIEESIHDHSIPAKKRAAVTKNGAKKKTDSKKKPASMKTERPGAKKAVKKGTKNRAGKTAQSKEDAMRAMAKQKLVVDSAAQRKALNAGAANSGEATSGAANSGVAKSGVAKSGEVKSRSSAVKKSVDVAGSSIVWTLLGLGLAACGGGGTKYISGTSPGEGPAVAGGGFGNAVDAIAGEEFFVGDGPIKGATVWYDVDGDGLLDEDRDVEIGKTNAAGKLPITEALLQKLSAALVAKGKSGIAHIDTGNPVGVIQVRPLGDNPATLDVVETDHPLAWGGSGVFTLADVKANRVRFMHDYDSQEKRIKLYIDEIRYTGADGEFDDANTNGTANQNDHVLTFDTATDAGKAKALVELTMSISDGRADGRQELRNLEDKIVSAFLIGKPSPIEDADIIMSFNSDKDTIRLVHDGAGEYETELSVWYKLANVDGGTKKNDLVVYSDKAGGDDNVYFILMNTTDRTFDKDYFYEDITAAEADAEPESSTLEWVYLTTQIVDATDNQTRTVFESPANYRVIVLVGGSSDVSATDVIKSFDSRKDKIKLIGSELTPDLPSADMVVYYKFANLDKDEKNLLNDLVLYSNEDGGNYGAFLIWQNYPGITTVTDLSTFTPDANYFEEEVTFLLATHGPDILEANLSPDIL